MDHEGPCVYDYGRCNGCVDKYYEERQNDEATPEGQEILSLDKCIFAFFFV
jgi:hypothetical protein